MFLFYHTMFWVFIYGKYVTFITLVTYDTIHFQHYYTSVTRECRDVTLFLHTYDPKVQSKCIFLVSYTKLCNTLIFGLLYLKINLRFFVKRNKLLVGILLFVFDLFPFLPTLSDKIVLKGNFNLFLFTTDHSDNLHRNMNSTSDYIVLFFLFILPIYNLLFLIYIGGKVCIFPYFIHDYLILFINPFFFLVECFVTLERIHFSYWIIFEITGFLKVSVLNHRNFCDVYWSIFYIF